MQPGMYVCCLYGRGLSDSFHQIIAGDYTLGVNTQTNPYHIPIIRAQLTSSLGMLIPEMRNEILVATEERIPLSEGICLDI